MKKLLLYFSLFLFSCSSKNQRLQNELREGDILFQNLNCGELCDAIEAVTHGIEGKDFSHCALVVKINDSLMVMEATGEKVQTNSLKHFFERSNDTAIIENITVARLKEKYRNLIPGAVDFFKQQVGQPYDDEFILNNGKWYCSELIYQSFKAANNDADFFTLNPMTFKNPKTNQYFPAWITYYENLNKEIPEGKPGISPGSISLSDKLEIVSIEKVNFN